MLLCINDWVLVSLKYPSKHDRLHQGPDYIVHGIDFDCATVVLRV